MKWNSQSSATEQDWKHTLNIKKSIQKSPRKPPNISHVVYNRVYSKINLSLGIVNLGLLISVCLALSDYVSWQQSFSINLLSNCKYRALFLFYLFTFYLQCSCFARGGKAHCSSLSTVGFCRFHLLSILSVMLSKCEGSHSESVHHTGTSSYQLQSLTVLLNVVLSVGSYVYPRPQRWQSHCGQSS